MADPVSWAVAGAVIAGTGAATQAGMAIHNSVQQKKAARSAADAARKAADTPVTVSTANKAGEAVSTEASAQKKVSGAAKRRLTVEGTAERFAASGLRKTLN